MRKTFITSDTYFGREEIIKIAKRPFKNVQEMNEVLIEKWNNVVSEDDVVYHLGNFAWDPLTAESVISELNGEIRFIKGQYDDALLEIVDYIEGIEILPGDIIIDSELKAVMSHWPLEEWQGKSNDIFHYHGATLKDLKTNMDKMNRVNVCCDNWRYTPQDIESLHLMFNEYKHPTKKTGK